MPTIIDPNTGQPIQVDAQTAQKLLAAGQAGLRPQDKLVFTNREGELFEVDANNVERAINDGFQLADDKVVAQKKLELKHGSFGDKALTFAESVADAATLGGAALLRKELGGEGFAQESAERRQVHSGAATAGTLAGIAGTALLTGGLGGAAGGGAALGGSTAARGLTAAARAATAPARGLLALGEAAGSAAARGLAQTAAKGMIGRAAAAAGQYAAAGAVEGGGFAAAQEITRQIQEDPELSAERVFLAAGEGALLGAAVGGAIGGAGRLTADAARAVKDARLIDRTAEWAKRTFDLKSIDDYIADRAYKGLGEATRKERYARDAQRVGGTTELGKFAVREGHFKAGRTLAEISESISDARQAIGAEKGALIARLDDVGTIDGAQIIKRIEDEVLVPMEKAGATRDMARALRRKLRHLYDDLLPRKVATSAEVMARPIPRNQMLAMLRAGKLRARKDLAPSQLWKQRQALDDVINWSRESKVADLIAATKNVRRSYERAFRDMAEELAESTGDGGFRSALEALDARYAKTAMLDDIVQDSLGHQAGANLRVISPSDYMTAIGGGAVSGSFVMGLLSGAANHILRKQGNRWLANYAAKRFGAQTAVQEAERLTEDAAETFLARMSRTVKESAGRAAKKATDLGTVLGVSLRDPVAAHPKLIHQIHQLKQEDSPDFQSALQDAAGVDPALGAAVADQQRRIADFLTRKLAESPNGGVMNDKRERKVGRSEAERVARYAAAAVNPRAALKRVAQGDGRPEDVETLRELYPRTWSEYVDRATIALGRARKLPPYQARLRIYDTLGVPVDATVNQGFFRALQASAVQSTTQGGRSARQPRASRNPPRLAEQHETKINRMMQ